MPDMHIKPARGKVLVRALPADTVIGEGLLFLPQSHADTREKEGARRGVVIAVGDEGEILQTAVFSNMVGMGPAGKNNGKVTGYRPHLVKEGDTVIFTRLWSVDERYKKIDLNFLGDPDKHEEFFMLDEYGEILAVVEA